MLLVVKEPDLGTALTYLILVGALLAGLNPVCGGRRVLVLVLWRRIIFSEGLSKSASSQLFDPTAIRAVPDISDSIQDRVARAVCGARANQVIPTQLRFLPVPHTDFIFSAEERVLACVVLVLALYFMLLMQIAKSLRRRRTGQECIFAWV
jgi:cell division protein FtsW (lipid II flippase)